MNDLDALIRAEIEPLLPLPVSAVASWEDVLRRAAPVRRPKRAWFAVAAAIILVAAAASVAPPVRSAIAGAFDDFSAWLTGHPGTQATPAEQQAFERANERTWAKFAPGTQLRRLLSVRRSGTEFRLFGYRSGDDLCLKVVAAGASRGEATGCAPQHDLQTSTQPAIVVAVDESIGGAVGPTGPDGYKANAYLATFGIASDGVDRIVVDGDSGMADAAIGGNAFLYIADHPKIGARVHSVRAVAANGRQVKLAFEGSPFGTFALAAPPKGSFHGPASVQRHLVGGTIGWLAHNQQRGEPLPASLKAKLDPMIEHLAHTRHSITANWPQQPVEPIIERELQPDPNDFTRIVLVGLSPGSSMNDRGAGVCIETIGNNSIGGGCSPLAQVFTHSPLQIGISGSGPSEYSLITGIASDDVARISAYLGSGTVVPVTLRDNAFVARIARAAYPLRIVAYDSAGKVISVHNFPNDGMTSPAPKAAQTSIHTIATVTGNHGGTATLRAGTPTGGYQCWSIDFSDGASQGGCTQSPTHDHPLRLLSVQPSSGDLFLIGQVPGNVAKVEIRFPNGTTKTIGTSNGFALAALPTKPSQRKTTVLELHAYNHAGTQLAKRGLRVELPRSN